jgi:hypothetical protein
MTSVTTEFLMQTQSQQIIITAKDKVVPINAK